MKIFLTCKLYSTDPTQVAKENKIISVPWCKHFDKINSTYVAISIISYTWCHNYKKKKRKEKKKKKVISKCVSVMSQEHLVVMQSNNDNMHCPRIMTYSILKEMLICISWYCFPLITNKSSHLYCIHMTISVSPSVIDKYLSFIPKIIPLG